MKRSGSRRGTKLGALAVCVLTLMSFWVTASQTVQEKQKVAKMTERMKTVCVGRFLIDLPIEAEISAGGYYVDGFDLSTAEEPETDFDERLKTLETELAKSKTASGRPNLESAEAISVDDLRGKILVSELERVELPEGEHRVMVESIDVRAMARLGGLTIEAQGKGRALGSEKRARRLLGQLRPLASDEIPSEPGFCAEHVIAREPLQDSTVERATLFAGIPGHPDVHIAFATMAGVDPAPGLLERHADAMQGQPFFMQAGITTLREGMRTTNGLSGDELAMRVRESNFTTGYSFRWEMGPSREHPRAPLVTLELESGTNPVTGGKPVQSTLSEEALNELWDRIISSIRIRPTKQAHAAPPAAPVVPLGANAVAGDICPQSGWWQCGDAGEGVGVLGGQRQFLKAGQRMPQALLLPEQTLWQRLRGVQPSYEGNHRTFWKLVDKRSSARLPPSPMLAQGVIANDSSNVPAGVVPHGLSQAPIGSIAKTGAACPASGWWRCEDSHSLDGTRWFAASSLLPPATFRAPVPTRGTGHPEYIHRRSMWQLVRHAEPGGDDAGPSGSPIIGSS